MSSLSELVADPLFQLNSLLWLTQPMPASSGVCPVLREAGFEVDAISLPLTPPPDILLRFKDSGLPHQDRICPDVVVCRRKDGRYGIIECKGNSFGLGSSTAEQARTLLVVAGPRLDESLGLKPGAVRRSVAAYLVPSPVADAMGATLNALHQELRGKELPAGESCLLALEAGAAALSLVADDLAKDFFSLPAYRVDFVCLEEGTDPRPLYFIPYDPDCDQAVNERAYAKRVLFERIQASLLGAVGRVRVPVELVLDTDRLLNDATLGMFGLWVKPSSIKHMRRLAHQLLGKLKEVLRTEAQEVLGFEQDRGWVLHIRSEVARDEICGVLSRFSCETMDLRQEPQPTLFDDLEGE